jgi:hypothetical protein
MKTKIAGVSIKIRTCHPHDTSQKDYLLSQLAQCLTNRMQESPWEANGLSANQEIPCLLQNPRVHYLLHKSML